MEERLVLPSLLFAPPIAFNLKGRSKKIWQCKLMGCVCFMSRLAVIVVWHSKLRLCRKKRTDFRCSFFPILSAQRISQKCVYLAQSLGSFWRAAFAFGMWEHEEVQGKRASIASAKRSRGGAQTEDSQTWWTALVERPVHSSEYLFDGVEYIDWRECFVCCRVVQYSVVLSRVGLWLQGKPGCKEKNHFQEQWRVEN